MSISFVVNGYYRSGTTLIWKVLHDNHKSVVLYEPLNPDLNVHMSGKDLTDKLHGLNLWESYKTFDFETRQLLVDKLPTSEERYLSEESDLIGYLNIIDNMPFSTILQTNRAHYSLSDIHKHYDSGIVHIIRHPKDVLVSIEKASYVSYKSWLKALYKWLTSHTEVCCDKFFIGKEFESIKYREGLETYYSQSPPLLKRPSRLRRMFSLVWIFSNYKALRLTEESDGLIVTYRDIVQHPCLVDNFLSDFLGCKRLDLDNYVRRKETSDWDKVASWIPNDLVERHESKIDTIVDYTDESSSMICG